MDLFRFTVGNLDDDYYRLQGCMPSWIKEVLTNDNPFGNKEPAKISFTLQPHSSSKLPDIPKEYYLIKSSGSRLNASRMLRIKKVFMFLVDKLGFNIDPLCMFTGSGSAPEANPKAMNIELLCNDRALNSRLTLATVKNFYWKASGDVVIHYRQIN